MQLSLVYLFLISSLRDKSIGADYYEYVNAFYRISETGTYYMEKGYVILNRLVALVSSHYIGIAIAVNLLLFIPIYYYIKKQVDEEYWGLCVFIFAFNPYMYLQATFNALRQACAIGIILYGLNIYLRGKKKGSSLVLYLLFVFFASLFHRIAFIMFVIPIVLRIKWKKQYWIIATIIALIMNISGTRYIGPIVSSTLRFYSGYLHYEASLLNNPIFVVFVLLVIFFLLIHYDGYTIIEKEKKRLIDLYLFSLCFLIAALPNDMFYRTYIILSVCAIPSIPVVCECTNLQFGRYRIKNEEFFVRKIYYLYYLCFYVGYIVYLAYNSNHFYIPYKFFF